MTNKIKSSLTKWGKELRDFCRENPQVTFNTPAQDQKEFRKSLAGMEITDHRIGMQSVFFTNKLMMNFFKQLEGGDMFMMFIGAGEGVYLTVIAKLDDFYISDDIPVNGRVDFHETKTYQRKCGGNVWLSHIVAATCVGKLRRQMCIVDPKGEIFREKAVKHGMSPYDYHQLYPKLKLLDTGERVCEVSNGVVYESPIYRVLDVSGGSVQLDKFRIQPDSRLTSCTMNHVGKMIPHAHFEYVPRM